MAIYSVRPSELPPISLPFGEEAARPDFYAAPSETAGSRFDPPVCVLILEPDPIRCERISASLQTTDRPTTALRVESTKGALSRLEEVLFDCVVISGAFLREDCLDLIRAVRSANRDLPVILLVDDDDAEAEAEAVRAGASACLNTANLDTGLFGAVLERAVEGRRIASECRRHQAELDNLRREQKEAKRALSERSCEVLELRNQLHFRTQEFENHSRLLRALQAIAEEAANTSRARDRFRLVLAHLMHLFDAEFGLLFLRRDRRFQLEAAIGLSPEALGRLSDLGDEADSWLLEQAVIREGSDSPTQRLLKVERSEGIESRATVPLIQNGRILGTLVLASRAYDRFSRLEQEQLGLCSAYLAAITLGGIAFESIACGESDEAAQAETQGRDRELEGFLYAISHDLKAPIISICGFAEVLQQEFGERLESDGRHWLTRITENAEKLHALIRDLLAFYQLDARSQEMVCCDMGQILGEAVESMEFEIHQARARVILPAKMPAVRCHPNQIYRLWANILSNALRHPFPEREPEIEVGFRDEPGNFAFWVRDNGCGIPDTQQAKVFGLFERLGKKPEPGSTGMGLAIARKIVNNHGGEIRLESREGEGTTVSFTLPREANRPADASMNLPSERMT